MGGCANTSTGGGQRTRLRRAPLVTLGAFGRPLARPATLRRTPWNDQFASFTLVVVLSALLLDSNPVDRNARGLPFREGAENERQPILTARLAESENRTAGVEPRVRRACLLGMLRMRPVIEVRSGFHHRQRWMAAGPLQRRL